jgi:opacity protein-like surface antigen
MTAQRRASVLRTALADFFIAGATADARAQSFVSPFIGFNFGGDAACPEITGCEDKRLNAGVTIGRMGSVLGFETDFGYANDFFGSAPGFSSSVLTLMGNVMLVPDLGPVRPYAVVGLGLIKTHVELTPESLFTTDNNELGWSLGGGAFIFFGDHVGVRGDVRYFHSFEELSILGITLGDTNLDFGRASGALVLRF